MELRLFKRAVNLSFFLLFFVLLGTGCSGEVNKNPTKNVNLPANLNKAVEVQQKDVLVPKSLIDTPVKTNINANIPISAPHQIVILPVPFTPQAPFAKWDDLHNEACEEASMVMAAEYFKGNKKMQLDQSYADAEILKLVQWEKDHGFTQDVTAQQVVTILKDYYNLAANVMQYDPQVIKQSISAHKVVLLPAAGRLLGNPYFRRPGPIYHMLVVKGYTPDEFITNDPGTRRGDNYRYIESVFANAVHDWNNGDVDKGQQVMIVVSGPHK